jgi:thiol:disulfide interchange protein
LKTTIWVLAIVMAAACLAASCQKATDATAMQSASTATAPRPGTGANAPDGGKMGAPSTKAVESTVESTPKQPAEGGIAWTTDYEKALETARARKRLVFVDFWATWCDNCKKFETDVFPNPEVAAKIGQFIAVHVDVDKHEDLAKQYGVDDRLPYLVVVDADGNVLAEQRGFCQAPDLIAFLEKGLAAKGK